MTKSMRKRSWIWTAVFCALVCMAALPPEIWPVVQAKEQSAEEREPSQTQEPASQGNLIYWDDGERAGIYAADFAFLYGKLSAVSGKIFEPEEYTHMHLWEYCDRDGRTHKRRCAVCGIELSDVHHAENEEDCVITSGGEKFAGRRYRCVCGHQWEREMAHVLSFDVVDETCHRSRCFLDGTEYCPGYEPVEETHYYDYSLDPSGTCYIGTCIDCGYQTEEEMEPEEEPEPKEEMEMEPEEEPEMKEEMEMEPEEEPEMKEEMEMEPEETSESSVSGNDCAGDETGEKAEKETRETMEEGGEV